MGLHEGTTQATTPGCQSGHILVSWLEEQVESARQGVISVTKLVFALPQRQVKLVSVHPAEVAASAKQLMAHVGICSTMLVSVVFDDDAVATAANSDRRIAFVCILIDRTTWAKCGDSLVRLPWVGTVV
jgi:hypothetical protein